MVWISKKHKNCKWCTVMFPNCLTKQLGDFRKKGAFYILLGTAGLILCFVSEYHISVLLGFVGAIAAGGFFVLARQKGELEPKNKEPNYDNLEKKVRTGATAANKMTEIELP